MKTDVVDIECQGKRLRVPRNLRDALQQLRHQHKEEILWADAICINQEDDLEKSHQIPLMRDIFGRANRVLIWLGHSEARYAKSAFELAGRIFRKDLTGIPPLSAPVWQGMEALFKQSWSWRLWCLQEVVLASSAEVLWGKARIQWKYLGYTAAWIRNTGYKLLRTLSLFGVYNASLVYSVSSGFEKGPFLHLMLLTRQFETSDSRDRVYAFLGIPTTDADPDDPKFFQEPDYSKDKYTLYEQLAHKFLETSRDLAFPAAVQRGPNVIAEPKIMDPSMGSQLYANHNASRAFS